MFDRFVDEYNTDRPHEALQQQTPQSVYSASERTYPRRLPPIEYPEEFQVRKVRHAGEIRFAGKLVFVGLTLYHEPVGLVQIDDDLWRMYFAMVPLGLLDAYKGQLHPIARRRKTGTKVRRAAPPAPPANLEKVSPISPV